MPVSGQAAQERRLTRKAYDMRRKMPHEEKRRRMSIHMMLTVFFMAAWMWFSRIPPKPEGLKRINKNGATEVHHASRGPHGSMFVTQDGQHYIRKRTGNIKIGKKIGAMLVRRQIRVRRVEIVKRVAVAGTTVSVIAALVALGIHLS